MRYDSCKDDPEVFEARTGMTIEDFNELVPYFGDYHQEYFRYRSLTGRPRRGVRSYTIYRNSPLPTIEDRLYFILFVLKNSPTTEVLSQLLDREQNQSFRWIQCLRVILRNALDEIETIPEAKERLLRRLDETEKKD